MLKTLISHKYSNSIPAFTMIKLPVVLTTVTLASAKLLSRQDVGDDYIESVCSPNITSPSPESIPPCIQVTTIQTDCETLDEIDSYQVCMCTTNAFFESWSGRMDCLYVHGAHSERDVTNWENILSSVSEDLCTGTPTASWPAIFSSVAEAATPVSTGATVLSDQYPSQTDVKVQCCKRKAQ
ncbi:hypothetical protein BDY21DRAFT_339430 [Lineolata rhizophorae]|uniref:Uncharacterized protein n=1 Tax=Lineolata rhizophorae TaxID=578093 RepID=A0A6A6P5B0_9PEZI|nr:hypothetical protein BDY21DRAFT_339430 [Lineolata rhizophorae]